MKGIFACGRVGTVWGPAVPRPFYFRRPRPPAITKIWRCCCSGEAWYQFHDGSIYHYPAPAAADATNVANALVHGHQFDRFVRRPQPVNLCCDKVLAVPGGMELIYANPPYANLQVAACPVSPLVFGGSLWTLAVGGAPNPSVTGVFDDLVCPCTATVDWPFGYVPFCHSVDYSTSVTLFQQPCTCYFRCVGSVAATSVNGMVMNITTDNTSSLHFQWLPGQSLTFMGTVVIGIFQPAVLNVHSTMTDNGQSGGQHLVTTMYTCGGV
jgi:hypothetical protein